MVKLEKASTGLNFGHLLRGDAVEAKKQIERLLSPRVQKVSVLSVTGNTPGKKGLELANLGVYGSESYAITKSGAMPNVMFNTFVKRLPLTLDESNRRVTTAPCVKSPVDCILKYVPTSFSRVVEPIDFLVIEGRPYEMIIGHTRLRKLKCVIDCGKKCFSLVKDGEKVTIPLVYEYTRDERSLDGRATDREDFTSDSEAAEGASGSRKSTNEEFLVMITNEDPYKDPP